MLSLDKAQKMGQSALKLFVLILLSMFIFGLSQGNAQSVLNFGPKETRINGSIVYSVIGKYKATFRQFQGQIIIDKQRCIQAVNLSIKAASITSNCPWCDRIVISERLLNAPRYPNITFKSEKILKQGQAYQVIGLLHLHGITKRLIFPFQAHLTVDAKTHHQWLDIRGEWKINRKIFNVLWNKWLDKGGVLVGDYITVNWGIKAPTLDIRKDLS